MIMDIKDLLIKETKKQIEAIENVKISPLSKEGQKYIENIYELVDSYIALLILTNDFQSIKILDNIVQQRN